MAKGFMRISREILDWDWYRDSNTFRVFFHLLMKAHYQDSIFRGVNVKRGQVITTRKILATELGLSEQNVRTSLKHLQKCGEILTSNQPANQPQPNQQLTNKFSVITICKYDSWQGVEPTTNQQLSENQPATSTEINPNIINKEKNNKEIKEELTKVSKKKSNTFIPPTIDEVSEYVKEKGFHFDAEAFVNFYESKGWFIGKNKMKDWKAACRTWERNRKDNSQSREEIGVIYQGSNTGKYDNMDLWE